MRTSQFFSVEDSSTQSAIVMFGDNEHYETLVRHYDSDETWEEFVKRVAFRVDYLNKNNLYKIQG